MALTVTLHVDTVKTMTCVTKRLVPVLMGVRVTGKGKGVTVSMKYCKNPNCNDTDTGIVGLDTFITMSAQQTLNFMNKTLHMLCNCNNEVPSNLFI